jgi:hypothetical protein
MRFAYWRASLRNAVASRQTVVDAISVALATAGAVTSPASLAKVFSAASAGTTAVNRSWDIRVLADRTIDAIMAAIELVRTTRKQVILTNLAKSVAEYSVHDGVRDAVDYDGSIGLDVGVAELTKETNKRLADEQKRLDDVNVQRSFEDKLKALKGTPAQSGTTPATPQR